MLGIDDVIPGRCRAALSLLAWFPALSPKVMSRVAECDCAMPQTIVQGIEATEIIPGRCEVIDEDQPFGCVVDAADTPGALSRLMDGLQECKPKRLILVLGCPGEDQEEKRPFMGEIAHYKARPPLQNPLTGPACSWLPAGCDQASAVFGDNPGAETPLHGWYHAL